DELRARLDALAAGEQAANLVSGGVREGRLVLVFAGQGSQRPGMGRELAAAFPVFDRALEEVFEAFDGLLDRPLREVMWAEPDSPEAALLSRTEFTQTAMFAFEVALFRLLERWELRPDMLIGHSVGELAAAHVAGVFSLEDACRLVAGRARLMGALPEGAMLAAQMTEEEALESLGEFEGRLALAAVNAPGSVVVSGEPEAVDEWAAKHGEDRKTKRLDVSHAFHSPLLDPILAELEELAGGIALEPPRLPVISNVTGEPLTAEQATSPAYWAEHARKPVRFGDGIAHAAGEGAEHYLELAPHPTLAAPIHDTLGELPATLTPALRKRDPEPQGVLAATAQLHANGIPVDWHAGGPERPRTPLPTYPFEHQTLWLTPDRSAHDLAANGLRPADHPLLAAAVHVADRGWLFTGRLSQRAQPWLGDHAVWDTVAASGTVLLELALQAADEVGCDLVEELTLESPLVLPADGDVEVQVAVADPAGDGRQTFEIHSREPSADERDWVRHASGVLALAEEDLPAAAGDAWPPPDAEPMDVEALYVELAERGYGYGPAYQGLRAAWRRGEEVFAEVSIDEEDAAGAERFAVHPTLLDPPFHAFLGGRVESGEDEIPLPFGWRGVRVHRAGATAIRARVAPTADGEASLVAVDEAGDPVVSVASMLSRPVPSSQLRALRGGARDSLFRL
ncbi:MAG: acyltransferase domain-containing protein, partial [Actinomycetota bacterium]|nr:acyltransferase domain-containing protein [Actinomycetota bacterium]